MGTCYQKKWLEHGTIHDTHSIKIFESSAQLYILKDMCYKSKEIQLNAIKTYQTITDLPDFETIYPDIVLDVLKRSAMTIHDSS